MKCKLCNEFLEKYPLEVNNDGELIHKIGETANMGNIECYFDDKQEDNWNCQTLSQLRNLFDWDNDILPNGVLHYNFEDQNVVIMDISEIEPISETDNYLRNIWFTWYKNRGRTDNIKILSENRNTRNPTEKEILEIIRHYKRT